MATVAQMMLRIDRLDIDTIVEQSIEQTKSDLLAENTAQMLSGLRKDQKPIKPLYAASTIRAKKKKGQPTDRVTLKDKGNLYGKIGAVVDNEQIIIDSDVEYSKHLEAKYGEIYGIGGRFKASYNEVLQPVIIDKIREKTGLK